MGINDFFNSMKGEILKNALLKQGIQPYQLEGVDFNNMEQLNQLAEARVIANNNAQTNELISRLAPAPTPSWIVSSPYTSIYPPTPTTTGA